MGTSLSVGSLLFGPGLIWLFVLFQRERGSEGRGTPGRQTDRTD